MKKITFFLTAIFLLSGYFSQAALRTASVTGNWSSTATWGGAAVPVAGDNIVINSGILVTVDVTTALVTTVLIKAPAANNGITISGTNVLNCGAITMTRPTVDFNSTIDVGTGTLNATSITIPGGVGVARYCLLTVSTGTINITGDITFSNTIAQARLTFTGAGTLNIGGNFLNGGTLTPDIGTINFNGSGTQTVGTYTYYNLTLSGSGTMTAGGNITVSNNFVSDGGTFSETAGTMTFGTLTINSGGTVTMLRAMTVSGATNITGTINFGSSNTTAKAMTFTGPITLNSGAVWNETTTLAAATFSFGDSFTNNSTTFTAQNTAHNFTGTGMTIDGTTAYVIPTVTFSGDYTNNGTLTSSTLLRVIGAGIRLTNNGTLTATTALSGTGGVIQGATGILNIGAASAITAIDAATPGNVVNYTGAAQTGKSITYSKLILSGSLAKTFATTPTVNDTLSLEGLATITVNNGVVTYGSAATLQYNTATSRTASSEEWITPFAATGGVIITNTGAITLNASKVLNASVPLTINSGASLTVLSTLRLTVGGTTTLNGTECLILKSDVSGTASFIDNGISGAGTAKVERYLTTDAWHYFSSPISNATALSFIFDYLMTSDPTTLTGWSGWITSTSTPLDVMRGYACWKPATNPGLETFSGTLNTGTQTFTGNRTATDPWAGWHLVGNPYPSSIDLLTGISWGQFESTAWFWDPVANNYTTYPAGGPGTHSRYAPPEQGFYAHIVNTYSGNTTLTMDNTTRVHNGVAFLKDAPVFRNDLLMIAQNSFNSYSDKLSVHFNPDATAGYDPGYDAYKLWGSSDAPQIYTQIGNINVTCNSLPFEQKNMVIPMGFSCGLPGIYTLIADSLGTFDDAISISLEDLKLNTTQDLRSNPVYNFTYDTADNANRFLLHFDNPILGGKDLKNIEQVQIYSFGSSVYIRSTDGTVLAGNVLIYDMLSRELYREQLVGTALNRITPGIAEGYYVVKTVTNAGVITKKIYLN